jgi:hypothetical protein
VWELPGVGSGPASGRRTMRNIFGLAMVAVVLAAAQVAAAETARVGNDSYVTRMKYQDLKAPEGRAALLAALQTSAARLCDGVRPLRDAELCARDVVATAERQAIPQVARAIRLARVEQQGVALAAR